MLSVKFPSLLSGLAPSFDTKKFVIAVSGGRDSVVLLHLMKQLLPPAQLVVAHFNHRTRGKESDGDEDFVRKLARKNGLVFERAERQGERHSENALREERLEFLRAVKKTQGCDFILLAHHLQDQLETVLMRLVRGTGMKGLAGIRAKRGIFLRPLLSVTRTEIELFATQRRLSFRVDSSNQSARYFRNRIRQELLPPLFLLAKEHGGSERFLRRFQNGINELQTVSDELSRAAKAALDQERFITPYFTRVSRGFFLQQQVPIQRRLLRQLVQDLSVETLSAVWVERILKFVQDGKKHLSAPQLELSLSCGQLYLQTKKQFAAVPNLNFHIQGKEISCPELGLKLECGCALKNTEWRQFRPGDRFGSKKLKTLFLEKKIPAPERALLPVLAKKNSSEVVWYYPEADARFRVSELAFPFS